MICHQIIQKHKKYVCIGTIYIYIRESEPKINIHENKVYVFVFCICILGRERLMIFYILQHPDDRDENCLSLISVG